jgi:hypothetical protein
VPESMLTSKEERMTLELWAFRAGLDSEGADLRGMAVHALDGSIGKVDEVVERESRAFLLVDTGPWIFGKTIKLPAGLVSGVDTEQAIVSVDRPKDEIKSAPERDGELFDDAAHEDALTRHYAVEKDDGAAVAAGSGPPASAAAPGGIPAAGLGAPESVAPADAGPATAAPVPEPTMPEPSRDDVPSSPSGIGEPPAVEEHAPESPPQQSDDTEPETPARRAPARPGGQAAERPAVAPARKRAETPSRDESAPPPAKRKAQRGKSSRNHQPLARYDSLTAAEVVSRLRALTQNELTKVERYERGGDGRQTILKRVAALREKEPWRGYDTATVKEVREKLARAKSDRVTAVRDYERRHRNRTGVMNAVRRRLESM